jgi:hypothetical protein
VSQQRGSCLFFPLQELNFTTGGRLDRNTMPSETFAGYDELNGYRLKVQSQESPPREIMLGCVVLYNMRAVCLQLSTPTSCIRRPLCAKLPVGLNYWPEIARELFEIIMG